MFKNLALAASLTASLTALIVPTAIEAQTRSSKVASTATAPDMAIAPALKAAVANYIRTNNPDLVGTPQIAAAPIADTDYYLVYMRYPQWCGSGGCHPDIFKRQGNTYVWAGELAVSRLPIRIIKGQAGSFPSIAISTNVPVGETMVSEYGVVPNTGKGWSKRWPSKTTRNPGGTVLISGNHFEPLW